jgi:RibD C-terminal domain
MTRRGRGHRARRLVEPLLQRRGGEVRSRSALVERRSATRAKDVRGVCGELAQHGGDRGGFRREDEHAPEVRRLQHAGRAARLEQLEPDQRRCRGSGRQAEGRARPEPPDVQQCRTDARLDGAGLIDEVRLWVHPVVVGSGQRLFPDGSAAANLKLVDTTTLSTGVVILAYRPA